MKVPTNLDYIASTTAQKISEVIGSIVKSNKKVKKDDLENLATKSLGILQSQGIYATMLFLMSRSGDKSDDESIEKSMSPEERCATEMISWFYTLLNPENFIENPPKYEDYKSGKKFNEVNSSKKEILRAVSETTNNLEKLLFVRDLWEQTLIYVRFHAKAYSPSENKEAKSA